MMYRMPIQTLDKREAPIPNKLIPPFVPAGTGFHGIKRR